MALIVTHDATDVEETSFQANGEVLDMEGEDEVYAYFEYWKKADEPEPEEPPAPELITKTAEQEIEDPGTFDQVITGLDRWTEYRFRAVYAYPEEKS